MSAAAEMPDLDFAAAIGRVNDTDDIAELRAIQRDLARRWPATRESAALTKVIERKIARLTASN